MKNLAIYTALASVCAFGLIAPDFLPNDPVEERETRYFQTETGTFVFREGINSVAAFYPRETIQLDSQDSSAITRACLDYIDSRPDIFVIGSDEILPITVANRLNRWWVTFAQFHDGILVEDGRIDFRVFESGAMAFCGANVFNNFESALPSISPEGAIETIENEYDIFGSITACDLVYWPDYSAGDAIARLAWRIDINQSPERQFRFYISAKDGKPFFHYSLVNFYDVVGSADINYLPKFYDDPIATGPYQFGNISLGFTTGVNSNASGEFSVSSYMTSSLPLRARLNGLWAEVVDVEGENGLYEYWLRPPAEHSFLFSTAFADSDEVNLYYHTTYIHEYYERLDPPMTALDYPVPARAGIASTPENAFWDGYGTNYGSGGSSMRNFALFANIIYHEYTHGVTGWFYEGVYFPYSGQSGAMNEGFSDYFACTNLNDARVGFKTPIYGLSMFRTMENNLKMPDDWSGEVHADGRIFGGALWSLRRFAGVSRADTIIHFTRYAKPNTFDGFVPEALFTDDDDDDLSNGTPNCVSIFNAFAKHGIGPGTFPQLDITYEIIERGDDDGFYEFGDTLIIVPKVFADGAFAWPDLVNLRGNLSIGEETGVRALDVTTAFTPTIHPGDSAFGDPFLLEITTEGESYFTDFVISYSALNITSEIADTHRFLIGFPQVLIVDDGPEVYERNLKYYLAAFDELGVTYFAHRNIDGPISVNSEEFDLVLWFTGDDTAGVAIGEGDIALMRSLLEGGGRLLLTGQNMTWQIDSSFLDEHFGAVHKSNNGGLALSGIGDNPILSDFENIYIFGSLGANNQRKLTSISPTRGEAVIKNNHGDTCAVIHDNGIGRTALFAFGLEAIGGNASSVSLPLLLSRLMDWFGVTMAAPECSPNLPTNAVLSVAPNPFNASCSIFPPPGAKKIEIYDVSGRLIRLFETENLDEAIIWDGRLSSGVEAASGTYLIKCIGGESAFSKAVLLR